MSHSDLKQTWEMANVQFVENLRVQEEAFSRVWNILTPDQRTTVQQQQQPQVGQLIDLQSPQTSPQLTNQQVVYCGLETNNIRKRLFVSGKRKDARPKHFKLGKTVNSYGTKLSKKHNCSLQNCFKNSL